MSILMRARGAPLFAIATEVLCELPEVFRSFRIAGITEDRFCPPSSINLFTRDEIVLGAEQIVQTEARPT